MTDRAFSFRFALYALAALALSAAISLPLSMRNATRRAESATRADARLIASMIASQLTPEQRSNPLFDKVGTARLVAAFSHADFLLVEIHGPQGQLMLSTDSALARTGAAKDPSLQPALAGRVSLTRLSLAKPGERPVAALEATAPIVAGDRVEGAIALYRPWAPIAAEIRSGVLLRMGTVMLALVLLYAALIPILRRLLRDRRTAEDSLRGQERLSQTIVEAAEEGIWVLGPDGRIVFANPRLGKLIGCSPEELAGRSVADLAVNEVTGGSREEVLLRRADGSVVWTLVSTHALGEGEGSVGLVADIDELKGTQRSLHSTTQRLAKIVAAQREIAELELDLDTALAGVVERAQELAGADGARLYFPDGDTLVARVAVGNGLTGSLQIPLEGSLAGLCARTGELQTSADTEADSRVAPIGARGSARSLVLVPLMGEAPPHPVIGVSYGRANGFDDEAVEVTRLMAEFATAALRNAAELQAKQQLLAALAESEERFRNAIHSSPIGFSLCTPDDRYAVVNDAYCRIVARTREELMGLTWRDVTHRDDLETANKLTRRLLEGELPHFENEQRLVRSDGQSVWVRASVSVIGTDGGEPAYVVAQVQDITDRRLLEQSLRERERLFRAVFDQSPIAKVVLDDRGVVLDSNAVACELCGVPREELAGRSLSEFAPSGVDYDGILEPLLAEAAPQAETELVSVFGERRSVVFTARAHVQPGRHLVLIQDVTEQRSLEDRLRQGQKMEAVGRLAGGIAHDFNNMLTAISGYDELMLARLEPGSDLHRHAEQIRGAAERAAGLTRQLLAFSRRQVLQPAALDLNEVVARMGDMITRLIGEDVRLETQLEPGAEPVLADEGQLEQVVVNLAVNARDAMPRGGVLTIRSATVNVDPTQAREAVATPGRYSLLTISDTGVGMDREQLSRLFEPFYTTKGETGVGLGLATVYGIVRQSGGFLEVESEPGAGSTFRIYLPVTALPAEQVADGGSSGAQPSGDETVLLVEDEPVVRSIVTEMLEDTGYAVIPAVDGAEALRLAGQHDGKIALLVTDVVMPGMSGQEVAERVAEARPGIRTLFVSGYNESAITSHGVLAPGTFFLEKPFSAADLARKVREILDGAAVT